MKYAEVDDKIFELFQSPAGKALYTSAGSTAYPQTCRAMLGFCVKTNFLKTALFDLVESENPYAFNAVFRCYCDHFLKFLYIFVRFIKERTDDAGRDYYKFCGAIEARDYVNAVILAERLIGNDVTTDLKKAIDQIYPEASTMSIAELESASGRFRYRSVLRYLSSEEPRLLSQQVPVLSKIVPLYAEFSSHVHGGPWADHGIYSYATHRDLAVFHARTSLAVAMSGWVLAFTALAFSREFPEHLALVAEIDQVLGQFEEALQDDLDVDENAPRTADS